jgi:hypothetical protein
MLWLVGKELRTLRLAAVSEAFFVRLHSVRAVRLSML